MINLRLDLHIYNMTHAAVNDNDEELVIQKIKYYTKDL